ncbi:MAG: copper chaperone PCu(A)C [Pseudomonadota bacterium]
MTTFTPHFSLQTSGPRHRKLAVVSAAALLAGLILQPLVVKAHDYKVGSIKIDHPWTRVTPPGVKVGAGYMTIENTGDTADKLIGGSFSLAKKLEMHTTEVTDGIARMREISGGLEIAPGATVTFQPGGKHLMFMGLSAALEDGKKIDGTLEFEKAGTVTVKFAVEPLSAKSGKAVDHSAHGHGAAKGDGHSSHGGHHDHGDHKGAHDDH